MTKPEWNSFDDLKAETLELRARIDAMAFRLVEMTDARNRAREALAVAREALHQVIAADNWGTLAAHSVSISVAKEALRETEAKP